jgi:hypothetical protein
MNKAARCSYRKPSNSCPACKAKAQRAPGKPDDTTSYAAILEAVAMYVRSNISLPEENGGI